MRKFNTFMVAAIAGAMPAMASWVSPANGTTYTLAALTGIDGTGVEKVGEHTYVMTDDLEISAGDTFQMTDGDTLRIGESKLLTIKGIADFDVANEAVVTRVEDGGAKGPKGIYCALDAACGTFKNIVFNYGTLRYGGEAPLIVENCTFENCTSNQTSNACINFAGPNTDNVIKNNTFKNCEVPAVAGGANVATGITIEDNYLYNMNTSNSNRPMLNLTVGGNAPVIVKNNYIEGTGLSKVGGITVANLLSIGGTNEVLVEGNTVKNCRYGCNLQGLMDASAINNEIIDNKYEPNPNNGGSGFSIYGACKAYLRGNTITGNIWGITVIGTTNETDLGTIADPGNNTFANNGNDAAGTTTWTAYDLYNNTTSKTWAQCNTWGVAVQDSVHIETVITHKADNPVLGEVVFMPAKEPFSGLNDVDVKKVDLGYDIMGATIVSNEATQITVYDLNGRQVAKSDDAATELNIDGLGTGIYVAVSKATGSTLKFQK